MRFRIKREEIWIQEIEVEAENLHEARKKASVEDGVINTDPQFRRLTSMDTWEGEMIKER